MAQISFAGEEPKPEPCPGWLQQNDCGDIGPKGKIRGVWWHDLCVKCAAKFSAAVAAGKKPPKLSGPQDKQALGF